MAWRVGLNDRISAGHFLSIAVSYPRILELFDADSMAGLKTLVHILRTCLVRILRGEGNSDTAAEPTPKKQIISLIHAVLPSLSSLSLFVLLFRGD
jgi:hypothetical protein